MSETVTTLVPDRLFVISHPYELDGTVTTYPAATRGRAPMQSYLLREGDEALLVGTGLAIHEEQMLADLEPLLDGARLSLMPLSLDFARMSNIRPIAERFGVERVYQPEYANAPRWWLNFRPDFAQDEHDALRRAAKGKMRIGDTVALGDGGRELELLVPPLRLLPHPWLYDPATRALLTVDVFGWVRDPVGGDSWILDDLDDDTTTVDAVHEFLIDNRYWWLAGGRTDRLRTMLAGVFERHPVDLICPDTGLVLRGAVVERHRDLLDQVLEKAAAEESVGLAVGEWKFGGS